MTDTQRSFSLAQRFARSWQALCPGGDATQPFARLTAAYREPHRHYHTLEHIDHALTWLDWTYSLAEEPDEIAVALWFHDFVYDPRGSDNERQSAHAARRELLAQGASEARCARVEALILATCDHTAARGDAALLVDIDLAILGASEEAFARFERQIREEYRAFDDASYARGRAAVLRKLASREPLYGSSFMSAELEPRAKQNLARAIEHWSRLSAAASGSSCSG